MRDASDLQTFNANPANRPGPFGNSTAAQKIDHILMSPKLFAKATGGVIFRLGAWGGTNGTLWPHYPEITEAAEAASDHCAIWVELAGA